MTLPYERATAGDRALAQAQKILEAFGCKSFGTMVDQEKQCVIVAFRWRDRSVQLEASWKGYAAAWLKEHPYPNSVTSLRTKHDRRALEIGRVAVCSVLRDWIKGQTTAVECGIMSFDSVFMPYMLLPSGERLIDRVEKLDLLGPSENNVEKNNGGKMKNVVIGYALMILGGVGMGFGIRGIIEQRADQQDSGMTVNCANAIGKSIVYSDQSGTYRIHCERVQ